MHLILTSTWILLLLLLHPCEAGCALSITDWRRITLAMGQRYYYAYFRDNADCDMNYPAPSSLIQQYGDCTSKTLAQAVTALGDTCETTLGSTLYAGDGQTQSQVVALASSYCSDALGDAVRNKFCDPLGVVGCPDPLQFADFSPFANCFINVLNMTDAQANVFFSTGQDAACTAQHNVCAGIAKWSTCPITLNETFNGLYQLDGPWKCTKYVLFSLAPTPQTDNSHTHTSLFKTVLPRCAWSFQKLYDNVYCVTPSFLAANGLWIGIGVAGAVVVGALLFFVYLRCYKAHHISHEELLSQSMLSMHDSLHLGNSSSSPGGSSQKMYIHPEMHAAIAKASKYRGVQFDSQTNQWAANGRQFSNEIEAAQAAYIMQAQQQLQQQQYRMQQQHQSMMMMQQQQQQQQMMGSPGGSGGSARFYQNSQGYSPPAYQYQEQQQQQQAPAPPPQLSPEAIMQQRKDQLVQFYEYWDPEKPNIPDHVETLFERHNFEHVARAVKQKYGVLPPGWEEELQM